MGDDFIGRLAPGILVILGSIINFASNLLKVKDLERRVTVLEEERRENHIMELVNRRLREEGR